MLDKNDRNSVEFVRKCTRIMIVAESSDGTVMQLPFDSRKYGDITKLCHDVGLSIQDFYNSRNGKK